MFRLMPTILFRNLETLQPTAQLHHQFEMIGEGLEDAETMSTSGIDMHRGRNTSLTEFLVIADSIDGQYRFIIVG